MSELMMELPETVSDARGTFRSWVMADEASDGRWEAWLEFVPTDRDTHCVYVTAMETRQHDRAAVSRWASGLSHVDAEAALARARLQQTPPSAAQLRLALQELVEALDRRIPQIERVGEAEISADATRLRACAMQRLAVLRQTEEPDVVHRDREKGTQYKSLPGFQPRRGVRMGG